MLEIKKGDVIDASAAKNGESQKGKWWFCTAKAEKGYDKITVWASNPETVIGANAVKVEEIESVKKTARKSQDGSKWYDEYQISAKLSIAEMKKAKETEFMDIPPQDEEILPFAF